MTDDRFWEIIDLSRTSTNGNGDTEPSCSPEALRSVLERCGDEEVSEFGAGFYSLLCDLNTWNLWAAGYVLAGGMSDDSFHYFRSWIIGKGKSCFAAAQRDPNELISFVGDEREFDNELLEYVAVEVMEERGKDDPREAGGRSPDDDPLGEPFDEDTVGDHYPELTKVSIRIGNWE